MELKFDKASAIGCMISADKFAKESMNDVPQKVDIIVKRKNTYDDSAYRFTFDPTFDHISVYQGLGGWLDTFMGFAEIQKNGKGVVVSYHWFGKRMVKIFNDINLEFVEGRYGDAETPESYAKAEEQDIEELKTENLPF